MSQTTSTPPGRAGAAASAAGVVTGLRKPVVVLAPARPGAGGPSRRRARAALLWGAAAALAASLALAAAVETVLPQLRDPEYGYRLALALRLQREHPDRPFVAVVGTSRTQNGIDPAAMGFPDRAGSPLVFNFGQSGAIAVRQRLIVQKMLAEGVRPAALVVEVFPAALAGEGPADHIFAPAAARLTAGDVRRLGPYLADPAALAGRWARERLNTWAAQGPVLLSHVAPEWQTWDMRVDHHWTMLTPRGHSPYPAHKAGEMRGERQARMRAQHAANLGNLRVGALSVRAYRDLAADCRARGIRLAFLVVPESPLVRSWYSPQSRAAVEVFLRSLTDELGCPVFAAPDGYGEEDFADGIHMLPHAAEKYSRWLADNHLKPWLARALK